MSDNVPAGWYPTPNGKQRYWDGEHWTNLPYEGVEPKVSSPSQKRQPRTSYLIIAGALVVLLLGVGGGIAWKLNSDAEAATAADAALEAAQAKEDAAAAAQDRKDTFERASRSLTVTDIEASVKAMAEGHAADQIIDGPIISASCSPVGGGSTDDLNEKTTVFECFVANKDNGDGTLSGYKYHSTVN